jgi:sensor histidine kinase regulating citrate/malate metabolism
MQTYITVAACIVALIAIIYAILKRIDCVALKAWLDDDNEQLQSKCSSLERQLSDANRHVRQLERDNRHKEEEIKDIKFRNSLGIDKITSEDAETIKSAHPKGRKSGTKRNTPSASSCDNSRSDCGCSDY